jgi:hypothetical protein
MLTLIKWKTPLFYQFQKLWQVIRGAHEYLSCKEGGSGQLDRMFKNPPDKRAESLGRITRNSKIYFAVFYESEQTKCKVIYEIEPEVLLAETERQLDRSSNAISHVGFSENWVKEHGRIVYQDNGNAAD